MFNYKVRSIFYVRLSISSRTISAETMRTPVFLKYAKVCTFSIINSNFCVGNYVFAFIHLVPQESCNLIVCACVVLFAIYKCHLFINVILKYLSDELGSASILAVISQWEERDFLAYCKRPPLNTHYNPNPQINGLIDLKIIMCVPSPQNISRDFQQNDFAAFSWTTVDLF